jgi:putative molybdopterin biosynthesis protein
MTSIVANRVAELRRVQRLSQGALARRAGISRQAIGAIENGRVQPGILVALSLARALQTSVEELFADPAARPLEAEIGAEKGGPRAAVAIVGGRIVARPLGASDAAWLEPAGGLIAASANGRARLEPLSADDRLETTIFLAGCEPALGLLAGHVNAGEGHAIWFPASNRDALADLAAGRVHAAALHGAGDELMRLLDRAGDVDLYELAAIEEGWIVARGNPRKLRGVRDLSRAGTRLANRASGSAARALLDAELRRAGIASYSVTGYRQALGSHADVARAVAFGYADIGIAVAGVAESFGLGFIPLRRERCVLALRRTDTRHPGVAFLLNALRSSNFRRDLAAFGAYDVARLGEAL